MQLAEEVAVLITEDTIEEISTRFDVSDDEVLRAKIGWYFVGEVDCDYWFAILSPAVFVNRYFFANEWQDTGKMGTVLRVTTTTRVD